MKDLPKSVGEKIRKTRKARNITQEQLALMCGIDRSYMSRIERGIVVITIEKLYQIAGKLDCEAYELLPARKKD